MIQRTGGGDRIILFTLVDLLVQIIFFGFFLFAVNQASQGEMQAKIALLARKFGVVSVTRYLDATSTLVSIADLGKIESVGASDKAVDIFNDTTKVIEGLDPDEASELAKMDKRERRSFSKMYTALSPADRALLATFISRYGTGFVRIAIARDLSGKQFRELLAALARLPAGDRGKFVHLALTFVKASSDKRGQIIAAADRVVMPLCFNASQALSITEIPSGFRVSPLIGDVVADVARALSTNAAVGSVYTLSESQFRSFSAAITGAHGTCIMRVHQSTTTNDERQFKMIQHWFLTD